MGADIWEVNGDGPSVVSTEEAYRWTKYVTGEPRQDFRYGAVRLPLPATQWLPAAISPKAIWIACRRCFPTPEAAVEWLRSADS